ncbi:unnamed protein product [Ectocarpus sp. 13 AM-2016]
MTDQVQKHARAPAAPAARRAGCFDDSRDRRIMPWAYVMSQKEPMSAMQCCLICDDGIDTHFGTQDSNECWCSSEPELSEFGPELNPGDCNMLCDGTTIGETWRDTRDECVRDHIIPGLRQRGVRCTVSARFLRRPADNGATLGLPGKIRRLKLLHTDRESLLFMDPRHDNCVYRVGRLPQETPNPDRRLGRCRKRCTENILRYAHARKEPRDESEGG